MGSERGAREALEVPEQRPEGKEAQPRGEPPPAARPDCVAGREGGSDPHPTLGGPWPFPGLSPLTRHPVRRRTFLTPLLVRWASRPVGRAGGGGRRRVPGGGAQLGHIWPEPGGTKWDRRPPFIPCGEGRPPCLLAMGRPEGSGDQAPDVWLGFQEIGAEAEGGIGAGARSWDPRVPPHLRLRWRRPFPTLKTAALDPALGPPRRRRPSALARASRGEEARLGEGKRQARK